jgi:hypothetical protein
MRARTVREEVRERGHRTDEQRAPVHRDDRPTGVPRI